MNSHDLILTIQTALSQNILSDISGNFYGFCGTMVLGILAMIFMAWGTRGCGGLGDTIMFSLAIAVVLIAMTGFYITNNQRLEKALVDFKEESITLTDWIATGHKYKLQNDKDGHQQYLFEVDKQTDLYGKTRTQVRTAIFTPEQLKNIEKALEKNGFQEAVNSLKNAAPNQLSLN